MPFHNLSAIQGVVASIQLQLSGIADIAGESVSSAQDGAAAVGKRNQIEDEWATLKTLLDDAKDKLDSD